MAEKKLTALEELEDMGFEILNVFISDFEEEQSNRKISMDLQLYEDGSWCIDSNNSDGMNSTIATGTMFIGILPILKQVKDIFSEAIKEIDLKK